MDVTALTSLVDSSLIFVSLVALVFVLVAKRRHKFISWFIDDGYGLSKDGFDPEEAAEELWNDHE